MTKLTLPSMHTAPAEQTVAMCFISAQAAADTVTVSNCVSPSPSCRVLPGAGLRDGAVESAEQHD